MILFCTSFVRSSFVYCLSVVCFVNIIIIIK